MNTDNVRYFVEMSFQNELIVDILRYPLGNTFVYKMSTNDV